MTKSISELKAFNETFTALEGSLEESLKFYKAQLEKSESFNQNFASQIFKTFQCFNEALDRVSKDLIEKSEKEIMLLSQIQNLQVQLNGERETVACLKGQEREFSLKFAKLEGRIAEDAARYSIDKQSLFKMYLKNIEELSEKLEEKVKVQDKDLRAFNGKIERNEDFFPVVNEDLLENALKDSHMFKEKYGEIQEMYNQLLQSTELLVQDIEEKSAEISYSRSNYENLLSRYETLSDEFYQYKQRHYSAKPEIEALNAKLSSHSELISNLKSKISNLTIDMSHLIEENKRLVSGEKINPKMTMRLIESIDKIYSLSQELHTLNSEKIRLSQDLNYETSKTNELMKEVKSKNQIIETLESKFNIFDDFAEYKSSTFALLSEELFKQEVQEKESNMQAYQEKVRTQAQQIEMLNRKNEGFLLEIHNLNSLIHSQSQELFTLKIAKPANPQAPKPSSENPNKDLFQPARIHQEHDNLRLILQDNLMLTEKVQELNLTLMQVQEDHINQITILQAELDVLRLIKNNEDYAKTQEDLAICKNYLKEVKYLLAINENELKEERSKRIHCEKVLRRLRKSMKKQEVKLMSFAEFRSLRLELDSTKKSLQETSQSFAELKQTSENNEKLLKDSLQTTREQLVYEKKSNEVHQRNIKKLMKSFNDISQLLESKMTENHFRDNYLNESKGQHALYQSLVSSSIQGKELNELCLLMHNRFESLIAVQDKQSFKSTYQIEELRVENSKLHLEVQKLRTSSHETEKTIQGLKESLKKAKETATQPEVLNKIVRLVHKSSLLSSKP